MTEVTQKLEDDGVAAFFKSFDSLLKVIEVRRQAELLNARASVSLAPEQRKDSDPALGEGFYDLEAHRTFTSERDQNPHGLVDRDQRHAK
jgi:hypothetical protein